MMLGHKGALNQHHNVLDSEGETRQKIEGTTTSEYLFTEREFSAC